MLYDKNNVRFDKVRHLNYNCSRFRSTNSERRNTPGKPSSSMARFRSSAEASRSSQRMACFNFFTLKAEAWSRRLPRVWEIPSTTTLSASCVTNSR